MPKINRITGVKVVGDAELELRFEDGLANRIDLTASDTGHRVFEPLKDRAYFAKCASTTTRRQADDADVCPDVSAIGAKPTTFEVRRYRSRISRAY